MFARVGDFEVDEWGNVRKIGSKKLKKPQTDDKGYTYVYSVSRDYGPQRRLRVHRLVALGHIPNPNNYPHINHIDGDKSNNHVSNLEWCTPAMNNRHAAESGLKPKYYKNRAIQIESDEIGHICFGKREIVAAGFNYVGLMCAMYDQRVYKRKWRVTAIHLN